MKLIHTYSSWEQDGLEIRLGSGLHEDHLFEAQSFLKKRKLQELRGQELALRYGYEMI